MKGANMKIEIENVEQIVDATVSNDGRIYGLKKYASRTVKVVVMKEERAK
jgi:hypothetical protein